MPIRALNKNTEQIFAKNVQESEMRASYWCPDCGGKMSYVNAELKVKHFRHLVTCECDSEPETPEHVWGKTSVHDEIAALGIGQVLPEERIGRLKCDVLWRLQGRKIAFEIQATNYDIGVYDDKIAYYTRKGYLIVYLFVGNNFCTPIKDRDNIYSLKEIEKRIFNDRKYKQSVIGGYLDDDGVLIPNFINKYAKGRGGTCENRFLIWKQGTIRKNLSDFLLSLMEYPLREHYTPPACTHKDTYYEKHAGKLIRYKEVCKVCDAFVKWLPNEQARSMGLELT